MNHSVGFQHVKKLLTNKSHFLSSPVLTAPNFDKQFKLYVDDSDMDTGSVLQQEDDQGI